MTSDVNKLRCPWANSDALLLAYHDKEWGVPSFDDAHIFEMMTLEGAQSGLSWLTILRKREGYRRAFAAFDPAEVAQFTDADVIGLLGDSAIVRNKAKIEATIANAVAIL